MRFSLFQVAGFRIVTWISRSIRVVCELSAERPIATPRPSAEKKDRGRMKRENKAIRCYQRWVFSWLSRQREIDLQFTKLALRINNFAIEQSRENPALSVNLLSTEQSGSLQRGFLVFWRWFFRSARACKSFSSIIALFRLKNSQSGGLSSASWRRRGALRETSGPVQPFVSLGFFGRSKIRSVLRNQYENNHLPASSWRIDFTSGLRVCM